MSWEHINLMHCFRQDFTFLLLDCFFSIHISQYLSILSLILYVTAQFFCLVTSFIYSAFIFVSSISIPSADFFLLIFHPFFRSLISLLRSTELSRGFCETLLVICICSSFHCLLFPLFVHSRTFLLIPWLFRLI